MRFNRLLSIALVLVPGLAWAQPYAFVSNTASDSVAVIDVGHDSLVGSLPLSELPTGSALSPDGTRLYVARSNAASLAAIDTLTGNMTFIPVGSAPAAVAIEPGGGRVYVANTGDDTVSVVETSTGTVLATIPVGDGPFGVVAGGGRAYVANWGEHSVSVIDTVSSTVVGSVAIGTFPAGLALDVSAGRLYVANFVADTVSVVDTTTLGVIATIDVPGRPRGLALDPVASRLYVAGFDSGEVSVVDTQTAAVVDQAPSGAPNPTHLALAGGGTRLYVVHLAAGKNVTVLDAGTLTPLSSIETPPGAAAIAGVGMQAPPIAGGRWRLVRASLKNLGARAAGLLAQPRATRPTQTPNGGFPPLFLHDGEFEPGDWEVYAETGGQSTDQNPTGGNPGAWRQTIHAPDFVETVHRFISVGSEYDPAVGGATDTFNFSWDRRVVPGNVAIVEGMIVTQGGVLYRSLGHLAFPTPWEHLADSLAADQFDDGAGGHPDFSAAGAPLRFGYYLRSFGPQVEVGIDNFQVLQVQDDQPGVVGFSQTHVMVSSGVQTPITIERLGGTSGQITATVKKDPFGHVDPGGTASLEWADGDGAPKQILVHYTVGDAGPIGVTIWHIDSVTGGAAINPLRADVPIHVYPLEVDFWIDQLITVLEVLLSGLSPAPLLMLAVPAVLLAAQRVRARRRP